MPSTSTYVQLSNYALVEYVYESEIITTTTARTLRLKNGYTEQYQFLNASSAVNLTGNVLDRSASRLGLDSTRWIYHDIDAAIPAIQTDSNFTLTDVTTSLTTNQRYDTVKVHLGAGYDFPGIDGFIVELQWEEWTPSGAGGRRFTAGAQVYIKSEQTVNFNSNPLFLGDRFYDRYVEFKVPSLADVNTDFWNSPTASNTIGYQYTFNNVGFLQSSQIFTNIYEIDLTTETNGNRFFQVGNVYRSSFNAADQYSYLGCVVKENTEYDYMEYYPTFYNGFIEDYIADLNSGQNGDWVVINQINVYEQAGTTMIRTSSNTLLQEDNFNEPAIFRPVIRNAAYVYSFTVEYIMRLMNKVDNTEIVRKSTVTSSSPKKYGYSLEKINVLEGFRPVKVYNKIERIESTTIQNSITAQEGAFGFGTPRVITQQLYVNNYYDVNNISVDSTTDVGSIIGTVVYPQGMNYIFINKFDNYVKFKVFGKSADRRTNVTFDFAATGMNVKLAFIFDDDSKVYIDATQDLAAANPGAGELLFKIDDILSTKLLKGVNRDYYLINKNDKNDEVLIYSGKFESQDKKTEIMAKINRSMINELDTQLTRIRKAQEALITPINRTVLDSANQRLSRSTTLTAQSQREKIQVIEKANAFVSSSTRGIDNAIRQAASESTTENPIQVNLNIPEVPGITPGLGAPISLLITPAVTQPSNPRASGTYYQRFIKGEIK